MAKSIQTFRKDPDATDQFGVDWDGSDPGPWLESGEIITASSWTADDGITIEDDTFGDSSTSVVVSGGTAGKCYKLTNAITTDTELSSGVFRTDQRTIEIMVENR